MGTTEHSNGASEMTGSPPPAVIDALGPFDLDPACPDHMPWPTASTMWTSGGLERPWHGLVWLNPPYSSVGEWMTKLADHGNGIVMNSFRSGRTLGGSTWSGESDRHSVPERALHVSLPRRLQASGELRCAVGVRSVRKPSCGAAPGRSERVGWSVNVHIRLGPDCHTAVQ